MGLPCPLKARSRPPAHAFPPGPGSNAEPPPQLGTSPVPQCGLGARLPDCHARSLESARHLGQMPRPTVSLPQVGHLGKGKERDRAPGLLFPNFQDLTSAGLTLQEKR